MDHAKIASKIREKIHQFSGKLSAGLPKTARRLVREVVFGVQSRGSVRLSEIARSLEESASMKKIIERLGRQLQRTGLRRKVRENLLELAAGRVDSQTLLVLDPTDVSKPYAKKMQYLAPVRDGSEGKIRDGYWCCQVIGVRRASAQVLPLYQELYSQEAPDFVSENEEMIKAIQVVHRAVGGRGTWVIDRGGDRVKLLKRPMKLELSFLIRQRGDRHLLWGRRRMSVENIAAACRRRHRETVVKETPEGEKVYPLAPAGVRICGLSVRWCRCCSTTGYNLERLRRAARRRLAGRAEHRSPQTGRGAGILLARRTPIAHVPSSLCEPGASTSTPHSVGPLPAIGIGLTKPNAGVRIARTSPKSESEAFGQPVNRGWPMHADRE